MGVVVIAPPAAPVATTVEAKAHLRVDHTDDDTYIAALVDAATNVLDGPSGWLGRALVQQTLEARYDVFALTLPPSLPLPYPPFVSITSVKYDDTTNVEQTLDPATYRVIGLPSTPIMIPSFNVVWPITIFQPEAVRIRYVAGYGADGSYVPAAIKYGLLMMVASLYEMRESATQGAAIQTVPTVEALLNPFRVFTPPSPPDALERARKYWSGSGYVAP